MDEPFGFRERIFERLVICLQSGAKTIGEIIDAEFGPHSGFHLSKTYLENLANGYVERHTGYTQPSQNGKAKILRLGISEDKYYVYCPIQNS